MKEYKNTMVNLKYTGPMSDFSIEMYLEEKSDVIRTTGVRAIKEAYDLNQEVAHVAEIEIQNEEEDLAGYIHFSVPKDKWSVFLEKSKDHLIELEEYELMTVVEDLLKKL